MNYAITLKGEHIKTDQTHPLESVNRTISSKLDIELKGSRTLNAKIPIHNELFDEIRQKFGSEFKESHFGVTDIYVI